MKKMRKLNALYYYNSIKWGPCQDYLKELEEQPYHPCNNIKTIDDKKYTNAKEWKEAMKIRIEKRNSINRALGRNTNKANRNKVDLHWLEIHNGG